MDNLHTLLKKRLKDHGLARHAKASQEVFFVEQWLQNHAPHLTDVVECIKVEDKVIYFTVSHSIVAQELQIVAHELVQSLNAENKCIADSIRILRK